MIITTEWNLWIPAFAGMMNLLKLITFNYLDGFRYLNRVSGMWFLYGAKKI